MPQSFYSITDCIPQALHFSPVTYYFITGSLYLYPFCPFLSPPSLFPLATATLSSVNEGSVPVLMFMCFHFQIPHINEIICYCLSLSDLFHLAYYSLGPLLLLQMARLHSFIWLSNIPLCMYVVCIHHLYSFIYGQILRLLLYVSYYK